MKVAKTFGIPKAQQGAIHLALRLPDGGFADLKDDTHDLSWLGFDNGSVVALHLDG